MAEFYKSVWFWLVIIGVVLLIAGIVYYIVFTTNTANAGKKIPITIWVLVGLGALLLVLGIIFAIFDSTPAVVVTESVGPVTKVTTQEQVRIPLEPMQVSTPIISSPAIAREPMLSRRTTDYYETPDVQTQVITRTTSAPTAPMMSNGVFEEPINRTTIYNPNVDPLAGRQVTTYTTSPNNINPIDTRQVTYVTSPTNVVRQRVPVVM